MNSKESVSSAIVPLKFGLLLNSTMVEKWQAEAIRLLLKDGHQLTLYILNTTAVPSQKLSDKLLNYPYRRLLFRIWYRFMFRPKSKQPEDITNLLRQAKMLQVQVLQKGSSQFFPEQAVKEIQKYQLDFILRFGFNILRGDVLKTARNGIWSFHHDDEQVIRGGPPGFWEVYFRHFANGVILQQLTNELDKGLILDKAYFPVIHHSWKAQLDQIYFQSVHMPARAARLLQYGQLHPEPSLSKAPVYKPPANHQMLRYLISMPLRRLFFHLRTLFLQEDWHIGLINKPLNEVIGNPAPSIASTQWLPRKLRSQYLADPFIIDYKDDTFLFAEQFDYVSGKGKIVAARQSNHFNRFEAVLQPAHHVSFPFVFIHEQELYCLPEQYASNRLDLYVWDNHSQIFQYIHTIMDDIQAIDPVLFEHDGLWWLLCGTKEMASTKLFAWYASELKGNYIPHKFNPVKTNIYNSRNAGKLSLVDGEITRFAQDAAKSYGQRIHINTLELGKYVFIEKHKGQINADPTVAYSKGLHTINGTAQLTVIDGKSYRFSRAGFRHQLLLKLKKR